MHRGIINVCRGILTDPELLNEKLSYYQADLNFKLGNFEEAIAMAKKQLTKSDRREVSELNKIIGESYFNLEQYGQQYNSTPT